MDLQSLERDWAGYVHPELLHQIPAGYCQGTGYNQLIHVLKIAPWHILNVHVYIQVDT